MKKFILSLVTLITVFSFVFGLVACNNHAHNWATEWSNNDTNHWHDCTESNCKQRNEITPHTWTLTSTLDNPSCTEEGMGVYTCFICGRAKTDVIAKSGHNWVLLKAEYEANCITEGRGTFRCADCAIIQDKMTIPPTGVHDYARTWTVEDAGHYHVCTVPGCGARTELENHVESGPIRIEEQDYRDGADETRCVDCNYLLSSVRRPAKSVPKSFDVEFSSTLPTDGKITLKNGVGYTLSYPNAVNEGGESISKVPYYTDGGVGVAIYVVTSEATGSETRITYLTEFAGFTTNQFTLYPKRVGRFTVKFKFMVGNTVKAETTVTIITAN